MADGAPVPPAASLDWDPVLAFLPWLQGDDPVVGEWVASELRDDGAWSAPYEALSSRSLALVQALYDQQVVAPFDWNRWVETAGEELVADRVGTVVAAASLDDVRRALTAHVRVARFSEGHLLDLLRSGGMRLLLERVGELVGARPDAPAA